MPGRAGAGSARPRRQRALSQSAIVEAALEIVDREGLDALTMRTVAHALGTGPASLYAYVGSKEEMIELLVERVVGEVRFGGEPDPARWAEQIKETAREMRRVFGSHGDLARASFGRIPVGENALRGAEWMMSVLRAGGVSDRVTALAVDLLSLYTMGVAYEDGLSRGTDPEQIGEFVGELRAFFQSLPADRFPNFVALADEVTSGDENTRFEFGLEVLIRGLAAVSAGEA